MAHNVDLTLPDRVSLLKQWIIPLLTFPARCYFPKEQVCSQLSTIYSVTLKLTSWGITSPILELPPKLGGYSLPQPAHFLHWQHAFPFLHYMQHPTSLNNTTTLHLTKWAKRHGVLLDRASLPWLQLGPIYEKTYPFLGTSAKSFSLIKKLLPPPSIHSLDTPLPLWNSFLFRDIHFNTYYSTPNISKKILHPSQLTTPIIHSLPTTWIPIYSKPITSTVTLPPLVTERTCTFKNLSTGSNGQSGSLSIHCWLRQLSWSQDKPQIPRKLGLYYSPPPPKLKHFIYTALWEKLPVG